MRSLSRLEIYTLCMIALLIVGTLAVSAYERARPRPWSDPATWRGRLPEAGADLTIPAGRTVVLDCNPPALHSITVDGTLRFKDKDVALTAGTISVHGRLEVGTEGHPFRHHATITLTGNNPDDGPKMLDVDGGSLDLHGTVRGPSWTRLAKTARAGETRILLQETPKWLPGDEIVIASTDFDPFQAEEATVKSVAGREVDLTVPLRYTHWGETEDGVEEYAEVGLLTRNIVVQGDDTSPSTGYGGQMIVFQSGTARLSGTAFTRMGQKHRLGCYPIHFHLIGEGRGSYVSNCSVFHCYNRCLTVHGTRDVLIENNVCYDTIGHCYFLEDGIETGNLFRNNLGLLTRKPKPGEAILPSDMTPATFWITNPSNRFIGNVAAGSQGNGFWLSFPKHPTGPSHSPTNDRTVFPRQSPLGEFASNVAHSNDNDGVFVDNGPNPPGVSETPNYNPPKGATFAYLIAYKNRRRGLWLRGSRLTVVRAKLADNSIGMTFAASKSVLRDSLIVGETANLGTSAPGDPTGAGGRSLPKPFEPHFPIRGFELYDGLVGAENVTFVNFQPNSLRKASALAYLRFTPFFIDQRNWIVGARFVNANRVLFEDRGTPGDRKQGGDGYRSAVFTDQDGAITGRPGVFIAANTAFLADTGAAVRHDWNALVSTAPYGRLFIDNRDPKPAEIAPVTLIRLDGSHPAQKMWGIPETGPDISFQTTLIAHKNYALRFTGPTPAHLRISLRYREPGDWIGISLPYSDFCFIYRDKDYTAPLPTARSFDTFRKANGACYFFAHHTLFVRLVVQPTSPAGEAVLDLSHTSLH